MWGEAGEGEAHLGSGIVDGMTVKRACAQQMVLF